MNACEKDFLERYDLYKKVYGTDKMFFYVLIRWNDGHLTLDLFSLGYTAEELEEKDWDDSVGFSFQNVNEIIPCMTALNFITDDFGGDSDKMYAEIKKYEESQEDIDHYFNSPEDFCIIETFEMMPTPYDK